MGKHHTEIRQFRIFALVLGEDFFIGKTASPRISAVYSRHRCGNVAATRETMDQEQPPSLYILEDLKCTGAEAYRHVLAWICRFEESGYCNINHTGTAIASENLYPSAEAILDKLLREPMDHILERTYVPKPSQADRKPSRIQTVLARSEKHVQMNLRMTEKDKRTFDRFCKTHNLKAREALGLLLDQIAGEKTHLDQFLSDQKALRQENERMKNQLDIWKGMALPTKEQRALEYLLFLKTGFSDYLQQIVPKPEGEPFPTTSYKRFKVRSGVHLEYPKKEGFLVMQAVAMLWGRNKSRFIVGYGSEGEWLKLRYYPKPVYMGPLIWEYPAGTRWLLGCQRAADSAMEVAAAFPLPLEWKQPKATPAPEEIDARSSLDDQIYSALMKK